jgi:hypothetical protein
MTRAEWTFVAIAIGGIWWLGRKVGDTAGEALDSAQLATTDYLANISGLAEYEQALLNATSVEEIRALQIAWEDRPFWLKF